MEAAISILTVIFITFQLVFTMIRADNVSNAKQTISQATKVANQNTLREIQEKYDEYKEITTTELLEKWLINFCDNESMDKLKKRLTMIMINESYI